MGSELGEIFQCREEVWVSVRNNVDEYLPVIRNRVRLWCLFDDLGKVDSGGVVVKLQSRVDLVQGFFTLKEHGAA